MRIRKRVAELGITCSAGLATSKTVAKIASDYQKPDSLTVVRPGTEAVFLSPLPVSVMSGIGPQTVARLGRLGVVTLGDLAAFDEETALEVLGSHGPSLVRRARGVDDRPVHENEPAKSVSNERTFATDVHDAEELDRALERLAVRVESRLHTKGIAGRTVTVKLRYSDFTTRTVRRTLASPTASAFEYLPVARELVASLWSPGVGVRLLGVGVSGFDERTEQLDLLEGMNEAESATPRKAEAERAIRAARGIEAVRTRFGDDAVRLGRELPRDEPNALRPQEPVRITRHRRGDPMTPATNLTHSWAPRLLAIALAASVSLCGCAAEQSGSGKPPASRSPTETTPTETTPTQPGTVEPGIKDLPNGRVQASGTVRHVDLEGGFWALTKLPDDPLSSKVDIVVVVVNAEEVGLPILEGQDALVNGTLNEGASIRMAGPEMTADEVFRPH